MSPHAVADSSWIAEAVKVAPGSVEILRIHELASGSEEYYRLDGIGYSYIILP